MIGWRVLDDRDTAVVLRIAERAGRLKVRLREWVLSAAPCSRGSVSSLLRNQQTNAQIGYVVIDLDPGERGSTAQLRKRLDGVPGTIRTRLLY